MSQREMNSSYTSVKPEYMGAVLPTVTGFMIEKYGMPKDAIFLNASVVTKASEGGVNIMSLEVQYAAQADEN